MHDLLVKIAKVVLFPLISVLTFAGYSVSSPTVVYKSVPAPAPAPIIKTVTVSPTKVPVKTVSTKLGGFNPTGGASYRLQNSVGISNNTVNLSSFTEPISNLPYTMSYLGSAIGYGTLDPQNPTKTEFISFSGITQNTDGSAQLTGVIRGLSRTPGTGGCVASTTLTQSHSGQSFFILSNSPCFYSEYAVKRNDENITGSWSFPTPLVGSNPATMTYVLNTITGTSTLNYNRISVAGTAGESFATGTIVYLKKADGFWYKAGTGINEATYSMLGISQGPGTASSLVSGGILLKGLDSNQTAQTTGSTYFLTSVVGTKATATTSRALGVAKSATEFYFDSDFIPLNNTNATFTQPVTFNNGLTTLSTSTIATTTINGSYPSGLIASQNATNTTSITANFNTSSVVHAIIAASSTNATNMDIYLNGDGGTNYRLFTGPSNTSTDNASLNPCMFISSGPGNLEIVTLDIFNIIGVEKVVKIQCNYFGGVGGGQSFGSSTQAIWLGSSNKTVNNITVTAATAGRLDTVGTFIKVYGDTYNP